MLTAFRGDQSNLARMAHLKDQKRLLSSVFQTLIILWGCLVYSVYSVWGIRETVASIVSIVPIVAVLNMRSAVQNRKKTGQKLEILAAAARTSSRVFHSNFLKSGN